MAAHGTRHPVILVPGFGGCQLWGNNDDDIWLVKDELKDYMSFADKMALQVNPDGTTNNRHNVFVRYPKITETMEWLDPDEDWDKKVFDFAQTTYFLRIADHLASKGFRRGVDLNGAPYDWRKAPNELQGFYDGLIPLIQTTFQNNGNRPVVLVAHSTGSLVLLHFLNNNVTQAWKDLHIKAVVSLAAPWRGSVHALRAVISGYKYAHPLWIMGRKRRLCFREAFRSMPGLIFQLPSDAENSCWHSKGELVDQPRHGYTVQEYGRLFADMGYQEGLAIWDATRDLFADLTAPGVEIHCLYGTGVDTPAKLIYKGNKFPDGYPKDEEEDGDGVVSSCSLEASRAWSTRRNSGKAVVHVPLKKVDHLEILEDKAVLDYIERVAITLEA